MMRLTLATGISDFVSGRSGQALRVTDHGEAGLSLIEIMVALFIIGLTTTVVVVTLPEAADPAVKVRDDLERQVSVLKRLSRTSGEAYGLDIENNGTRALVFRKGLWEPADHLGEFGALKLEPTMTLEPVERERRQFENSRILIPEDEPLSPELWFGPSGIATGKDYYLTSKRSRVRIHVERNGDFRAEAEG